MNSNHEPDFRFSDVKNNKENDESKFIDEHYLYKLFDTRSTPFRCPVFFSSWQNH